MFLQTYKNKKHFYEVKKEVDNEKWKENLSFSVKFLSCNSLFFFLSHPTIRTDFFLSFSLNFLKSFSFNLKEKIQPQFQIHHHMILIFLFQSLFSLFLSSFFHSFLFPSFSHYFFSLIHSFFFLFQSLFQFTFSIFSFFSLLSLSFFLMLSLSLFLSFLLFYFFSSQRLTFFSHFHTFLSLFVSL